MLTYKKVSRYPSVMAKHWYLGKGGAWITAQMVEFQIHCVRGCEGEQLVARVAPYWASVCESHTSL